ncbi:hypothetical protein CNMCM5878_003892 [Aspergillus fumigatiaffinis]|nr:hypothetical protein CNMCM5878_003892 [Aspergillus fumigatiaffinis]
MMPYEHVGWLELREMEHLKPILRHSLNMNVKPQNVVSLDWGQDLQFQSSYASCDDPFGIEVTLLEGEIEWKIYYDERFITSDTVAKLLGDFTRVFKELNGFNQITALYLIQHTGVIITMVVPGLCTAGLGCNTQTFTKIMHKVLRAMMAQTAEGWTILHGLLVPTWLTNEEGQKLQKGIWNELVSRLESVQPGCISKLK